MTVPADSDRAMRSRVDGSPEPGAAPDPIRTPLPGPCCPVCGVSLGGRAARVCSPRCRTARYRQQQADQAALVVATLQARVAELEAECQTLRPQAAENVSLRRKVAEQAALFANLKRQWQGRRR
jgi:predicted nucleic acid-binding Zn ribbon protein